jgi:hypothetical protein
MGQLLFEPPSVFGWDWEQSWVSSATMLARYSFVRDVATSREGGRAAFRPGGLMDLNLTAPLAIVNAVLEVLGIPDQVTATEKSILVDYLTDGGAVSTLHLHDEYVQYKKLGGLFLLVMQMPAFQVH